MRLIDGLISLSPDITGGRGRLPLRGLRGVTMIERASAGITSSIITLAAIILLTAISAPAQTRETRQLTSNNIIALAGSGDTVWLATERGLNYRTSIHSQEGWPGFEENDFGERFRGLAFGGGSAAALVYKKDAVNTIGFWRFNHADGKRREEFFRFSNDVLYDDCEGCSYSPQADPTGHIVYARENFWASFNRGGIVRYNPADNTLHAMRPGDSAEVHPQNIAPIDAGDSARIVTGLGVSADGNLLLIATPSTYWTYDPEIRVWAEIDTIPPDPVYSAIDSTDFRLMLAAAGDVANPEINDKLFLPQTDSAGTLVIATTTGLYICESANPLAGVYGDFTLIRYVREVKANEAYALPGIIRGGADDRYGKAVFVYKLKKDGNVTINVYDYRMSLVKTVVKSERRSAVSERSTVPARDFWDGTNRSGRKVSPGVYYFKITSTGGERHFGKVILAK
ncbi:MAG: hypothetical protein FWC23_01640 [Chitinispirillia bacterium]|nr:hypothetical protein [Chitinispirillia bacterium]MCL2267879.1 hypothetical protein [Chitinispirillia bacterium]